MNTNERELKRSLGHLATRTRRSLFGATVRTSLYRRAFFIRVYSCSFAVQIVPAKA
jgi:hypothetical protein